MAFVTPWSISLALADTYSVLLKQLPHEPRLLSMVLAGDTVSKNKKKECFINLPNV